VSVAEARLAATANDPRFMLGDPRGHYESWFLRGNHPSRPLAFWVRYTIFSPRGRPEAAVGELWAIAFDGEAQRHVAVRREAPMARCRFGAGDLDVDIDGARLSPGAGRGEIDGLGGRVAWELGWSGEQAPLLLLPARYYSGGFPKAKALVPGPLVTFSGWLDVDGERLEVDGWRGSQNHNWGSRHTDLYTWGQVMGFDDAPGSCLEIATGQVRLGPVMTPRMTVAVLRHAGRELRLNALHRSLGRARRVGGRWDFDARARDVRVTGTIEAPPEAFVCVRYGNPPGGVKLCLNSKLARAELRVWLDGAASPEVLTSAHGAAFEILSDHESFGLPPAAGPTE